jgi:Tfp pilus assembly protein PilF
VSRHLGDEALEGLYTEKAIHGGVNRPELYFNLGVIYGKAGRYEEAIRAMKTGLEGDSNRPDILNAVGVFIMQGRKNYGTALPYFLNALAQDSNYSLAYLNAGICCYNIGKKDGTRYYLKKFLEIQPHYPGAEGVQKMLQESNR